MPRPRRFHRRGRPLTGLTPPDHHHCVTIEKVGRGQTGSGVGMEDRKQPNSRGGRKAAA